MALPGLVFGIMESLTHFYQVCPHSCFRLKTIYSVPAVVEMMLLQQIIGIKVNR